MTALDTYAKLEAEAKYLVAAGAPERSVILNFGERSLVISDFEEVPLAHWPLASLSARDAVDGGVQIAPDAFSEERIILTDPIMIEAIEEVCPTLYRTETPAPQPARARTRWRLWMALPLLAVVLVATLWALGRPDARLMLLPPAQAVTLGEAMAGAIRTKLGGGVPLRVCAAPEGAVALRALLARVTPTGPDTRPLHVKVLDYPEIRVIGLPGGAVLLSSAALEAAGTPEEVAGVLAHEIGHLARRDATRAVLAATGLADTLRLALDGWRGEVPAEAVGGLLAHRHGLLAEAEADVTTRELLVAAGLPATGHVRYLARLAALEGAGADYAAAHPDPGDREAAALAADTVGGGAFQPALNDRGWLALRNICDG